MRVAIFSDIHGNAVALEAVLADVRSLAPQAIVCGGDLAFGGPEPEACVDRIKEVGIPCVRGNTDQWLGGSGREPGNAVGEWSRAKLPPTARQWLAALPFDHRLEDLLIVHATPWSITEPIPKGADVSTLRRMLVEGRAAAVVYGHIHEGWIGEVAGGGLVVNAGSVGAPYDGDPRASYAVLERGASTWSADLRRVPYDIDRAVRTFPAEHPARAQWADAIRSARRPF
jgi:putative phosphoesterase